MYRFFGTNSDSGSLLQLQPVYPICAREKQQDHWLHSILLVKLKLCIRLLDIALVPSFDVSRQDDVSILAHSLQKELLSERGIMQHGFRREKQKKVSNGFKQSSVFVWRQAVNSNISLTRANSNQCCYHEAQCAPINPQNVGDAPSGALNIAQIHGRRACAIFGMVSHLHPSLLTDRGNLCCRDLISAANVVLQINLIAQIHLVRAHLHRVTL